MRNSSGKRSVRHSIYIDLGTLSDANVREQWFGNIHRNVHPFSITNRRNRSPGRHHLARLVEQLRYGSPYRRSYRTVANLPPGNRYLLFRLPQGRFCGGNFLGTGQVLEFFKGRPRGFILGLTGAKRSQGGIILFAADTVFLIEPLCPCPLLLGKF